MGRRVSASSDGVRRTAGPVRRARYDGQPEIFSDRKEYCIAAHSGGNTATGIAAVEFPVSSPQRVTGVAAADICRPRRYQKVDDPSLSGSAPCRVPVGRDRRRFPQPVVVLRGSWRSVHSNPERLLRRAFQCFAGGTTARKNMQVPRAAATAATSGNRRISE